MACQRLIINRLTRKTLMFLEVQLTSFRQHRDLTVQFGPGLNAIRGANEAGKTTIIEAITYAMFGARALRESLADTVTWGEKETALKVRLDFQAGAEAMRCYRGKSGAAIYRLGDESVPVITGQDEVKRFFEGLLGAKADVAARLMMASQKSLQGALEDGPGAAVKLIETLSNFSLIDRIIDRLQEALPNGNTDAIKSRIALLEAQQGPEPVDPTQPLAAARAAAWEVASQATVALAGAKQAWDAHQPAALAADVTIKDYNHLQSELVSKTEQAERVMREWEAIEPVPGPSEEELAGLRLLVQDASRIDKAREAYRALQKIEEPEMEWDGDRASLQAELDKVERERIAWAGQITIAQIDATRLEGQLIKEAKCAFCEKDLAGVPEVVQRNSALMPRIQEKRDFINGSQLRVDELDAMAREYRDVLRDGERIERHVRPHNDYVRVDGRFVPPRVEYIGPSLEVLNRAAGEDPRARLRAAEAKAAAYQRAVGQKEQAWATLTRLNREAAEIGSKVDAAKEAVAAAEGTLQRATELSLALGEAQAQAAAANDALAAAEGELRHAQAMYQQTLEHWKMLGKQLEQARQEFKDMTWTNALITKIRKARPKVADELWSIVNASIGKHFSDIRGTPSKVTREDNDFKVDGHSISGLSGSTMDALGLAVRVGLTKTFLPNTSFMSLDEPAAACDEVRERNMLGMIAASGFDQVLLITHSDQCESVANSVVRI